MPGRIRLEEFEIRPGMKYCSNWVEIQWIYSQFDWSNSTGHEILLKMGVNSLRLYLYACLIELGIISMDLLPIRPVFHAGRI